MVSSYNYADRICAALDSVDRQTLAELELIIVDDASTDDSLDVITSWLQSHADRFARTLLLQHASNAGLAAARNTAFSHSSSAWCFVLDADNTLMPQALRPVSRWRMLHRCKRLWFIPWWKSRVPGGLTRLGPR